MRNILDNLDIVGWQSQNFQLNKMRHEKIADWTEYLFELIKPFYISDFRRVSASKEDQISLKCDRNMSSKPFNLSSRTP